jgi:hypothetical protein
MTDLGNGRVAGQKAAVPTPSCIRPRRSPADQGGAIGSAARASGPSIGSAARASEPSIGSAARASEPSIGSAARASGPAIALAAAGSGGSGRDAAREELGAVLAGVALGGRDRQFLSRLVHWDKRNAASVVSLLRRARQAGREEVALTPRQLETVLAALGDAARYRSSGVAATGCWDCENIPSGRCADHAKDNDRALAYAELAAALVGGCGDGGLPEPRDLSGYRRRRPVAS